MKTVFLHFTMTEERLLQNEFGKNLLLKFEHKAK